MSSPDNCWRETAGSGECWCEIAPTLVVGGGAATAARLATQAGPQSDGTAITPVGFKVTPAGAQTPSYAALKTANP